MINEILSPEVLTPEIEHRILELEESIVKLQKSLKKAPEGSLWVHKKGTYTQYGIYLNENNESKLKYLSVKEKKLIQELQQKSYNEKILFALKNQVLCLRKTLSFLKEESPEVVFNHLSEEKQKLTIPVTLSNEEYAKQWQSKKYEAPGFSENSLLYVTQSGLRVRSKSEIIIADLLQQKKVPFLYEFPVELKTYFGKKIFHPDFYCLNLRTRQEFYWEHFGMMDDPEYSANAVGKLKIFNENHFKQGKNLIITMESQSNPLTAKETLRVIEDFLM
ncbi:MAG: hypothetical protein KIG96_09795 [Treponema sp.]|nr:hypothetical protein [Treponema sp.]